MVGHGPSSMVTLAPNISQKKNLFLVHFLDVVALCKFFTHLRKMSIKAWYIFHQFWKKCQKIQEEGVPNYLYCEITNFSKFSNVASSSWIPLLFIYILTDYFCYVYLCLATYLDETIIIHNFCLASEKFLKHIEKQHMTIKHFRNNYSIRWCNHKGYLNLFKVLSHFQPCFIFTMLKAI